MKEQIRKIAEEIPEDAAFFIVYKHEDGHNGVSSTGDINPTVVSGFFGESYGHGIKDEYLDEAEAHLEIIIDALRNGFMKIIEKRRNSEIKKEDE